MRDPVVLAFVAIPLVLVAALAAGVYIAWVRAGAVHPERAALLTVVAAAAWMAITWWAAASGILADWQRTPPPFAFLVLSIVIVSFALAFSTAGARLSTHLPLWVLVGVQSFRLPLELAMHAMYERGVMPVEMSYSGRNFDIVTGATAIVVALLVRSGHAGRLVVAAWNVVGLALLLNIVTVAVLATPRFQYFGPDHLNVWVMQTPFVWLPAVMVLAALAGHLLVGRALFASPQISAR
jgi:hypothetical protein